MYMYVISIADTLLAVLTCHQRSVGKCIDLFLVFLLVIPGMPVQSVGFIPQGHHPGMTPMQGVVLGARQPQNPPVSDPHSVTHSQSMDDGFSGFQKAAPVTSSGGQTKEDDFGEFLHAPSNSGLGTIQL